MKLFLDDIRNPPDNTWVVCRTAEEAIKCLKTGKVTLISFDHDLGEASDLNGNDVAKWIERSVFDKQSGVHMPKWQVHSMNPVGRRNIIATMMAAERAYSAARR